LLERTERERETKWKTCVYRKNILKLYI
jgi:hypothetical protein